MKAIVRFALIVVTVMVVMSATSLSPSTAHAASLYGAGGTGNPFSGFDARNCGGIQLHLTGKDEFTVHCLPKLPPRNGSGKSPFTNENSDGGCQGSDIAFHLNINYNDTLRSNSIYPLCINGTGSISNFQNIIACLVTLGFCSNDCWLYNCLTGPTSWNDIASSFYTGAWYGRIYVNANLSGAWAQFNPNEYCTNMTMMDYSFTSGPTNFNDAISSISVQGTYSEGPAVC